MHRSFRKLTPLNIFSFRGNPFSGGNHTAFNNNGMFYNHFNANNNGMPKREQQMQVHKEASKESSLEGGSQSSKKGGNKQVENKLIGDEDNQLGIMSPTEDEINPNSIVQEDEQNQSPMHS